MALDEKQIQWLIANYGNMNNSDIANSLGVNKRKIVYEAHKIGLRKSEHFISCVQDKAQRAARVVNKQMNYPPKGYVIPNRGIFFSSIRKNIERFGCEKEAMRKISVSNRMNEIRKSETRRLLFGLPQKTNLRVSISTKKVRDKKANIRYRLRSKGYDVPFGSSIAYYNSSTNRSFAVESTASKCGISTMKNDIEKIKLDMTIAIVDAYDGTIELNLL